VVAKWLDGLGREVGLGPSDIVLDGDPAPLPKKGAGWSKMPLGMEVCFGAGHIVLHGDPGFPQNADTKCVETSAQQ